MSWRMKLLRRRRGDTKNKIFPRNEISPVPGELVIKVVLMISLGFLPSCPSPGFHDTLHHLALGVSTRPTSCVPITVSDATDVTICALRWARHGRHLRLWRWSLQPVWGDSP